MKFVLRILFVAAVLIALLLLVPKYWWHLSPDNLPPTMEPDGSATDPGIIITRETIDWEVVIKRALSQRSRFLTLTLKEDRIRDQDIKDSLLKDVLDEFDLDVSSNARVRVKYHVEYPIGFVLEPGTFAVVGDAKGVGIGLRRPQLVARPSVKLLSAKVIESGLTIDEQAALVKLQQRVQPEAERRAAKLLKQRKDVLPKSEAALRAFLEPILATQTKGTKPPKIHFKYYN